MNEDIEVLKKAYYDMYGHTYASARAQMDVLDYEIKNCPKTGFRTTEEAAEWAHEHHLDMVVYTQTSKRYFYCTHEGTVLSRSDWKDHHCKDMLFTFEEGRNGNFRRIPWEPDGRFMANARIMGETTDGVHKPLYHRDYFQPAGFFDPARGTFNTALPIPVAAKATGRDTSHIYTYINHLAGRCAPYLLAWLRQKCMYPHIKTEVCPVISSRQQGTGKTTFADVICRALFGKENVMVTDKFDTSNKFNADYADKIVVCAEEKHENDSRVDAASLKSMITADTVRKEHKGLDPYMQKSCTEFVITTNKDVPIRIESEDQRRFMILDVDPDFRRFTEDDERRGRVKTEKNVLAEEVFNKLRGTDSARNPVGVPFVDDIALIQQFKHELYMDERIASINPRDFPRDTNAAIRCLSLPRTSEATEVESVMKTLAPFLKESLRQRSLVTSVASEDGRAPLMLEHYVPTNDALAYVPAIGDQPAYIAVCKPLVFYDQHNNKPFVHATTERITFDCASWLKRDYGLIVLNYQGALAGGFPGIQGRHRMAPALRIALEEDIKEEAVVYVAKTIQNTFVEKESRQGERLRVNGQWQIDPMGEFETVNEMLPGTTTLTRKTEHVAYMDHMVFEADDTSNVIEQLEKQRLSGVEEIRAEILYAERLATQKAVADELLDNGTACRVVYSGGKSYHIVVQLEDAPKTVNEYKWLHAHLCTGLSDKVAFDFKCCDPARLTRAPIEFERIQVIDGVTVRGLQLLYRDAPGQKYSYNWRIQYQAWLSRPMDRLERFAGRKLVPCKREYKEAMEALLTGTFFTNRDFDGRRNELFFPAYRLCRSLGFSHDKLWNDGGILEDVGLYYKQGEIGYWKSREHCDLIKEIDDDYD